MADYKLLVFDWDGTLMDSQALIISSMQAAIADAGGEARSDAQVRNIIGLGLKEAIQALFPQQNDLFVQAVRDAYREQFFHQNQTPSRLFPGVRAVLDELLEEGYWLAVATGKGTAGLRKVLAETEMKGLFHATRTAEETCSKPDPMMLFELMQELDFRPDETLLIGDTEYDLNMARAAKVDGLGVACGAHEVDRLWECKPVGVLQDVRALPAWLQTLGAAGCESGC
ncbi:MAG: HAD-IA family hydrolase [Gammaproteobacteria bacterium]|nr:HAD-IA family hydrolase [Gammaproteobacteria bacterium]